VLVESNFEGTNPSASRPWTSTYTKAAGYGFTGWDRGSGISTATGNDALVFSQNMPAAETDSTLAAAITANQYWTASLQPPAGQTMNLRGAELRFTIRRIDFHAPRRYAVFSGIGGFGAGSELFTTARFTSTVDQEFSFTLPDTAAYGAISGTVEFRIVGFSGQFAGHRTSISSFKITRVASAFDRWVESSFTPAEQVTPGITGRTDDPDGDGLTNFFEYSCGGLPSRSTGPLVLVGANVSQRGLPVLDTAIRGDGAAFHALFTRRKDFAAAGLTYTVCFSADLAAWEDSAANPVVVASDADFDAVTVPFPAALSDGRRPLFFRVRVAGG
jgi:hypothetical protein